MENASKALIMAGTILISLMIISLGVYIVNMFGEYAKGEEEERLSHQIDEFNAQFLKYEGRTDITAQDIVTVANLAKASNDSYEFTIANPTANENTYYIEVNIRTTNYTKNNFEKVENKEAELLKEENFITTITNADGENETIIKRYTCSNIELSPVTKQVYRITFTD